MKWAARFPTTPKKRTTSHRRQKPKRHGNPTRRTARAKPPGKPGRQLTNQGGKVVSGKSEGQRAKSVGLRAKESRPSLPFALCPLLWAALAPFLPILVLQARLTYLRTKGSKNG